MSKKGVYPVYENQFKIDKTGGDGATEDSLVTIADMESFSVSIDGNVEEWKPFDHEGWTRRLVTGKSITISVSGKRNIGDAGNDYVAGLKFKTGQAATTVFEWDMPDGTKVKFDCVANITSGGGDSTNVDGIEIEVLSDGAPTITP